MKTVQFKNPTYIGDPLNAVRIFNAKGVDELILLDISAGRDNKTIPFGLIAKIAEECFMPLTFGGGIRSLDDIKQLLQAGVEKISLNSAALHHPDLVWQAAEIFGSQSIIISIDVKKMGQGVYEVFADGGGRATGIEPVLWARRMEECGAGEIFLNAIDCDGTMSGYDLELIQKVSSAINIPVIACGGAGKMEDFSAAVDEGRASAVAAGSFFVFHGRRRAVLINFPTKSEWEELRGV